MKRFVPYLTVAAVALVVGLAIGWVWASSVSEARLDRVVAMSWGDGKYKSSFYGAHVYLEPAADGYAVRARVYIGRGNDQSVTGSDLAFCPSPTPAAASVVPFSRRSSCNCRGI